MKKIIFIIVHLVCVVGFCQAQNGDVMKCLRNLTEHTKGQGFEIPNRSTFLYMFKEGFGVGKYSEETRTGALVVERNSIRVCDFFWSLSEPTSFVLKDGAGKIRYNYEHGKETPFREISYWKGFSAEKPACNVVSDDLNAKMMIKKIILAAVKKDMETHHGGKYKLPDGCQQAGVGEKEMFALNKELGRSLTESIPQRQSPASQQAPGSESQGTKVEL